VTSATSPITSSFRTLIDLMPPCSFSSNAARDKFSLSTSIPSLLMNPLEKKVAARSTSPLSTVLHNVSTLFDGFADKLQPVFIPSRVSKVSPSRNREYPVQTSPVKQSFIMRRLTSYKDSDSGRALWYNKQPDSLI